VLTAIAKIYDSRGVYDAMDTDFINDILNLPWFYRTWTVQELVLAREAVFICGSTCLSWSQFIESLQILQVYVNGLPLESNEESVSNPASFYDHTRCYRTLAGIINGPRSGSTISTALKLVRTKLSSDSRDKVYGLYGIFDYIKIPSLPPVDYNKAVHHI